MCSERRRQRACLLFSLSWQLAHLAFILEELWVHCTDGHNLPETGQEEAKEELLKQTVKRFCVDIVECLDDYLQTGVTAAQARRVCEFREQFERYIKWYLMRVKRARKQYAVPAPNPDNQFLHRVRVEHLLEPEGIYDWHRQLVSRSPAARFAPRIAKLLDDLSHCFAGSDRAVFVIGRLVWPEFLRTICGYCPSAMPPQIRSTDPCDWGRRSIPAEFEVAYYRNLARRLDEEMHGLTEAFPFLQGIDWHFVDSQQAGPFARLMPDERAIHAKIEFLLGTIERRLNDPMSSLCDVGYLGLTVDMAHRQVQRGSQVITLQQHQTWQIFLKLLASRDRICPYESLDFALRDQPADGARSKAISRLRAKLNPLRIGIEVKRDIGCRLVDLDTSTENN